MTVVRLFSEIRTQYSTWEQLKAFLTSDVGGKLIVIGDGPKVIIRYDKKISNFEILHVHAFRSVVWDTVANIPVSIAPFKVSSGDIQAYTILQDFVEGVMIQAYLTWEDTKIHLASRTKLGADTRFYSKRNFSELICDAPQYASLATLIPVPTSPEKIPYSFASLVLQHPEHRIVTPVSEARLYMISIGHVYSDGTIEIGENPSRWSPEAAAMAPQSFLAPAGEFNPLLFIASQGIQNGWQWQGFVMKNTETLQRWRFRNPLYTIVRDLRGGEADSYSRFLRLRRGAQLEIYLAYYPEDAKEFYECDAKLRDQSMEIFNEYNAVHRGLKAVRKSLKDVGWPLNKCVYALHGLYMSEMKPKNIELTIDNVIQYVNNMEPLKQRALLVTPVGGKIRKVFEVDEIDIDEAV